MLAGSAARMEPAVKMALLVCNSYFLDRLMQVLKDCEIDYFTSWDNARGKGHGTEPHLGNRVYGSTNSVTMIAFEEDAPLEALVRGVEAANREIARAADRIRLFQLPLERVL